MYFSRMPHSRAYLSSYSAQIDMESLLCFHCSNDMNSTACVFCLIVPRPLHDERCGEHEKCVDGLPTQLLLGKEICPNTAQWAHKRDLYLERL